MTLPPDNRNDIVNYRIEKAYSSLTEAKSVVALDFWNLAVNRLYYAVYYISVALLISRGIETTTHKGAIRMIGYSFVKDGLLTPADSQLLGRLFSMRQTGDYEDLYDWKERDVVPLIPQVEEYIERVRKLIELANEKTG
ncbi:MAG: HEPN domain-containing protein [Muribaculaceae bacterium]|nr:HEPN domain-containing protein [Muribaculaceae bacterium]